MKTKIKVIYKPLNSFDGYNKPFCFIVRIQLSNCTR